MGSDEKILLLEAIGKLREDMIELPAGSEELKKQNDALCKLLEQYRETEKLELENLKADVSVRSSKEELEVKKHIAKREHIIKYVEIAMKLLGTVAASALALKVILIILEYERDGSVRSKTLNLALKLLRIPV